MNQKPFSPKGVTERLIELIIALVVLGFIVQLVIDVIKPLIPYAVGGLMVFGVGYLIYKKRSQW